MEDFRKLRQAGFIVEMGGLYYPEREIRISPQKGDKDNYLHAARYLK